MPEPTERRLSMDIKLASLETKLIDLKEEIIRDRKESREDSNRTIDQLRKMHEDHYSKSEEQGHKLVELSGLVHQSIVISNGAKDDVSKIRADIWRWAKIGLLWILGVGGGGTGITMAIKEIAKNLP